MQRTQKRIRYVKPLQWFNRNTNEETTCFELTKVNGIGENVISCNEYYYETARIFPMLDTTHLFMLSFQVCLNAEIGENNQTKQTTVKSTQ